MDGPTDIPSYKAVHLGLRTPHNLRQKETKGERGKQREKLHLKEFGKVILRVEFIQFGKTRFEVMNSKAGSLEISMKGKNHG